MIVFVVGCVCLFAALHRRLGEETTRRFLLLLLFATGFAHELRNFNNEVFSGLALGGGLIGLLLTSGVTRLLAVPAIVLGTANMPAMAIGMTAALLIVVKHTKQLRWLIVPPLCAAAILLENWLRRGSPWTSGYEGNVGNKTVLPYSGLPGFSYPFVLGFLSIFFSFGKGLLFFYPALFVPVRRWFKTRELAVLHASWLVAVAGLVMVYSRWWSWYGGLCWGPRFFLFASLPASLTLALWSERRGSLLSCLAGLIVTAMSFWVGFDGFVFGLMDTGICTENNYSLEAFCWYVPEFTPLIRPFIVPHDWLEWEISALYLFCAAYMRIAAGMWWNLITSLQLRITGWAARIPSELRALRP